MKRLTFITFLLCAFSQLCVADTLKNQVSITEQGNQRIIRSNGIPDHSPGQFPNRHNPNSIFEQKYVFCMPLHPKENRTVTPVGHYLFGVALNGVPFDPGTAEYWRGNRRMGWRYEALSGKIDLGLDHHQAHVQPSGAYHYHGLVKSLINDSKMSLVGYAADGFPIYAKYGHTNPENPESPLKEMRSSYRLKRGIRSSGPGGKYDGTFLQDYEFAEGSGDLDQCNGRYGVTPEYPQGIYHYFLTSEFPYIPRCFHGTPDPSFRHHQGPPPRKQRPPPRRNT